MGVGSRLGEPVLRPAGEEDVAALKAVAREAYGVYVERIGREVRPMRDDYADVMRRLQVTVAELQGEVAGLIAYGPDDDGFVIDNVAVRPTAQGAGVGRALMEHAEAAAQEAGYDSIYLYTHELMTENQALYERLGYVEYARERDGDAALVFMRKALGFSRGCP